jgi:hypothetical protein
MSSARRRLSYPHIYYPRFKTNQETRRNVSYKVTDVMSDIVYKIAALSFPAVGFRAPYCGPNRKHLTIL